MSAQLSIISQLGFPSAEWVRGRASIADLFKPDERCGIYILSFANGEFYASQAVDLTRRYVQHCKKHPDIDALTFKKVAHEQLNAVEREVIEMLERKGFKLRNIALTSLPKGASDFDLIMEPAEQERWLHDLSYVDDAGDRLQNEELRRKYTRSFQKFITTPQAEVVVGDARDARDQGRRQLAYQAQAAVQVRRGAVAQTLDLGLSGGKQRSALCGKHAARRAPRRLRARTRPARSHPPCA